ncbi:MAG: hypothetical protein BRD29_00800, partial [Bacteroidetes bacterium QH_2_67_10]
MPSPAPPDEAPAVDRPSDGSASASGAREDIERVVERQRRAVKRELPPPVDERKGRLRRLRRAVMERRSAIQEALHADFRKPPEEVDASEIKVLIGDIDHALSELASWVKPRSVGTPALLTGTRSEVRVEPKGTVLILAPWNYPLTLTLGPLVSALAAGNRVVVKPSEFTPHASGVMRELVAETFDEAHVALFEGDKAVAETLLEQPFDHVYFTGSPAVGKKVMKAAAEHLASVTLELGGKSPAVVDETADVEDAARKIAWSKFTNAGQTCIAPDYVLVHEGQKARLVYAIRRRLRQFYGATPEERKASPDYARLVNDKHFDRVTGLLEDAVERGAHVSEGGEADRGERYVPPTILTDVPRGARVMERRSAIQEALHADFRKPRVSTTRSCTTSTLSCPSAGPARAGRGAPTASAASASCPTSAPCCTGASAPARWNGSTRPTTTRPAASSTRPCGGFSGGERTGGWRLGRKREGARSLLGSVFPLLTKGRKTKTPTLPHSQPQPCTTTSSSAAARRGACWRIASAPTATRASCCSPAKACPRAKARPCTGRPRSRPFSSAGCRGRSMRTNGGRPPARLRCAPRPLPATPPRAEGARRACRRICAASMRAANPSRSPTGPTPIRSRRHSCALPSPRACPTRQRGPAARARGSVCIGPSSRRAAPLPSPPPTGAP